MIRSTNDLMYMQWSIRQTRTGQSIRVDLVQCPVEITQGGAPEQARTQAVDGLQQQLQTLTGEDCMMNQHLLLTYMWLLCTAASVN